MQTSHRIVIGILVGLLFAGGYTARMSNMSVENAVLQKNVTVEVGDQYASTALEGGSVDFRPFETFYVFLENLRRHYVDSITPETEGKMTYDALRAMLGSLNDPNTRFVEPEQKQVIADAAEGKFHGIGAILGVKRVKSEDFTEEHLIVINSLPTSPAEKAGLKPGDDIVAVNGKVILPFDPYQRIEKMIKDARKSPAEQRKKFQAILEAEQKRLESGMMIVDAEALLMGKDKKEVELTVERRGVKDAVKVKIEPHDFTVDPVSTAIVEGEKFGYIKLNTLTRQTAEPLSDALKQMDSKNISGIVLDLRNVSGGEADSAKQAASLFAPKKTFAVLQQSRGRKSTVGIPEAEGQMHVWRKPVVVLVNGGTARMAEVLASALKDNGVAKLVGEKTYGDLAYTTMMEQADGSAVIMTTGMFLTGRGGNYNGIGIPVDVSVASAGDGDPQLAEAIKQLGSSAGRS